jgi:type II secretory pathway pseudopilin PulG
MRMHGKGLTLIESLVSMFLISALLVALLGAFLISRISAVRAKNRHIAAALAREYLEQEIMAGYHDMVSPDDGYNCISSGDPFTRSVDGVTFTIAPYPYDPDNWNMLSYGDISYKVVGFIVTWTEPLLGGAGQECSERTVTYVALHS